MSDKNQTENSPEAIVENLNRHRTQLIDYYSKENMELFWKHLLFDNKLSFIEYYIENLKGNLNRDDVKPETIENMISFIYRLFPDPIMSNAQMVVETCLYDQSIIKLLIIKSKTDKNAFDALKELTNIVNQNNTSISEEKLNIIYRAYAGLGIRPRKGMNENDFYYVHRIRLSVWSLKYFFNIAPTRGRDRDYHNPTVEDTGCDMVHHFDKDTVSYNTVENIWSRKKYLKFYHLYELESISHFSQKYGISGLNFSN